MGREAAGKLAHREQLVRLEDARTRLELKRGLVAWMNRICGGALNGLESQGGSPPAALAIGALFLMQEELGRLADEMLGRRAPDARRALARALAVDANALMADVDRAPARAPMQSAPVDLISDTERTAARALEFVLLTAARSGEVRGATWGEIDLETGMWVVPADRMKAKKEHRVPLSKAAITLLKQLPRVDRSVSTDATVRSAMPLSDTVFPVTVLFSGFHRLMSGGSMFTGSCLVSSQGRSHSSSAG